MANVPQFNLVLLYNRCIRYKNYSTGISLKQYISQLRIHFPRFFPSTSFLLSFFIYIKEKRFENLLKEDLSIKLTKTEYKLLNILKTINKRIIDKRQQTRNR